MITTETEKLVREYTALATMYDHRWAAYLDASLRMTIVSKKDYGFARRPVNAAYETQGAISR
jgi:hypothetical protein